ncbi:ABC transporter substrate-binding protein [Nocardioides yefusunii]|uniref:ABC transporter substrate-binding protein n=1 Tax=Nocardioides yefusunii TaxID=2500546 RepID=A0ABW1QW16_9ACTN|nr:ABC transporter substrate-binding protein [Nocardioides yefusunii]
MNTRVRRGASALALATLPLSLVACSSSDTDEKKDTTSGAVACPWEPDTSVTTKARIAWQAIPNADVVVKDQGLLEACLPNAEISWVQASSGGDVIKYYGAGEVDLGLMGSAPAARAASAPLNQDIDLQVVWIHDIIGDAESLIVKDGAASDIAGLQGKKIAVPFSSTAHYSLLQAIGDAGLDASDFDIINLEPEQMPAAWSTGDIDAAWVWDPAQSKLIADGGERILSSADTAEAGRPTFDVGTVSTEFLAANTAFVNAWAKVQDHAVSVIKDDPAKAAESVAVVLGITPEDAEKQFAGLKYLTASEQAGKDYLGGNFADDLFTTATFLATQPDGIKAVGTAEEYAAHVAAGPAAAVAE